MEFYSHFVVYDAAWGMRNERGADPSCVIPVHTVISVVVCLSQACVAAAGM